MIVNYEGAWGYLNLVRFDCRGGCRVNTIFLVDNLGRLQLRDPSKHPAGDPRDKPVCLSLRGSTGGAVPQTVCDLGFRCSAVRVHSPRSPREPPIPFNPYMRQYCCSRWLSGKSFAVITECNDTVLGTMCFFIFGTCRGLTGLGIVSRVFLYSVHVSCSAARGTSSGAWLRWPGISSAVLSSMSAGRPHDSMSANSSA